MICKYTDLKITEPINSFTLTIKLFRTLQLANMFLEEKPAIKVIFNF